MIKNINIISFSKLMLVQRLGQDSKQIERLTLIVHRAIDFLAPSFCVDPSDYCNRYPTIYLGPQCYGNGEMGLPIQTQEGDSCVGHETGHVLHEWINPEVTVLPQLFGSPEFVICEVVAKYAETLYLRRPIPCDISFDLAQLLAIDKQMAQRHFKELERLGKRLIG